MIIIERMVNNALKRHNVSDAFTMDDLIIEIKYYPRAGIYRLTLTDSKSWLTIGSEWKIEETYASAAERHVEIAVLALYQGVKKRDIRNET